MASFSPNSIRAAVAALQVNHDKVHNLSLIRETIEAASKEGGQLLVLPECTLQGFLFHPDGRIDPDETSYLWQNSETIPGPSTLQIAEWTAEFGMTVVLGLWEQVHYPATPILYNSAVLIGPEGIIGVFRKVHQPTEESHHYTPGRDWPVFETPLAKIGMMICYDQCFPEAGRELTLRGAEVLVIPNAWPASDRASNDRYDFFGRARAAENNRWVLQSNLVGPSDKGEFVYLGKSRIIAPNGLVVAETKTGEEGLAVAEIVPTKFDPTRARSGWYLQQRVPESYPTIGQPYKKID
jgi:predicted amidohydrolase